MTSEMQEIYGCRLKPMDLFSIYPAGMETLQTTVLSSSRQKEPHLFSYPIFQNFFHDPLDI